MPNHARVWTQLYANVNRRTVLAHIRQMAKQQKDWRETQYAKRALLFSLLPDDTQQRIIGDARICPALVARTSVMWRNVVRRRREQGVYWMRISSFYAVTAMVASWLDGVYVANAYTHGRFRSGPKLPQGSSSAVGVKVSTWWAVAYTDTGSLYQGKILDEELTQVVGQEADGQEAFFGDGCKNGRVVGVDIGETGGLERHIAFWTDKGELWTYGNGCQGQLGHGESNCTKFFPEKVHLKEDLFVAGASCGCSHTLVWTKCGTLFGFGRAWAGALGIGTTSVNNVWLPEQITKLSQKFVKGASCGNRQSCVWTEDGKLFSFGTGKLGHCVPADAHTRCPSPLRVIGGHVTEDTFVHSAQCGAYHTIIASSEPHSLVVDISGYGAGSDGQLAQEGASHRMLYRSAARCRKLGEFSLRSPTSVSQVGLCCGMGSSFVWRDGFGAHSQGRNTGGQLVQGDVRGYDAGAAAAGVPGVWIPKKAVFAPMVIPPY